MEEELERRLERSGRFDDASAVDVVAVRVNDYGEGEYEARFTWARDRDVTGDRDFLAGLKLRLEDVLPRAWVAAFTVSAHGRGGDEVTVTFDYLPEGTLIPA